MKKIQLFSALILFFASSFLLYSSVPDSEINNYPLGCVGVEKQKNLSDDFDPWETEGEFLGQKIDVPEIIDTFAYILGDQAGNKRIEVNLANQHVYAFEGNSIVFDYIVSTGKWYPTPRGTFSIQKKVRAQKMSGGNKAIGTYYYLPNVPWVMFYGNNKIPWWRGFSFHGAYWHNNFGTPMSHGCVNMKIPEAEQLYYWAPIGTPVIVY